jgi:hypothetical protein
MTKSRIILVSVLVEWTLRTNIGIGAIDGNIPERVAKTLRRIFSMSRVAVPNQLSFCYRVSRSKLSNTPLVTIMAR